MPKKKKKTSHYFTEEHERAVRKYIKCKDETERLKIYEKSLHTPLETMISGIRARYGYTSIYMTEEAHVQKVLSHLYQKLDKYNPDRYNTTEEIREVKMKIKKLRKAGKNGKAHLLQKELDGMREAPRAFSYYQTIVKNYLTKIANDEEKRHKKYALSYDDFAKSVQHDENYSYLIDETPTTSESTIFYDFLATMEKLMRTQSNLKTMSKDQIKLGEAIIDIFKNWKSTFVNLHKSGMRKFEIINTIRDKTGFTKEKLQKNLEVFMELYQVYKAKGKRSK